MGSEPPGIRLGREVFPGQLSVSVMKTKCSSIIVWLLCFCLPLLAATPAGAQVGPQYRTDLEPPRIIAGPYLQSTAEDSMTIIWLTDKNSTAWVEYGGREPLHHKAVAMHDGLIDANTHLHKIRLSGLVPGTQYQYRVGSTEIVKVGPYSVTFGTNLVSRTATFETLNKQVDRVSAVVMKDRHQNAQTLQAFWALVKDKPVDLVVFNGDSLDYLESEEQIMGQLLQPISELFASTVPLIYVRGNHETRGQFALSARLHCFAQREILLLLRCRAGSFCRAGHRRGQSRLPPGLQRTD